MIQPHELMIGNYVWNPYNEPTNVDMSILTYLYKCKRDQQKNVMYFPIPLNKEWLIKFGFIQDGFKQFYIKTNHRQEIRITQDFDYVYVIDNPNSREPSKDIVVVWNKDIKGLISVHQLQNLYQSLTGEQLTIK